MPEFSKYHKFLSHACNYSFKGGILASLDHQQIAFFLGVKLAIAYFGEDTVCLAHISCIMPLLEMRCACKLHVMLALLYNISIHTCLQ